jgi:hypothetical protein
MTALLVGFAGCVQSADVRCGQDRVCPGGTACDDVHELCVLPEQLEVCTGKLDGEACTISPTSTGTCRDEVCLTSICGDGIASEVEQCDGDDLKGIATCKGAGYYDLEPLGCTPQCMFDVSQCTRRCGDGTLDPEEQCDASDLGTDMMGAPMTCKSLGYYDEPGLGCTPLCTYDVDSCSGICGDGIVNGGELCEGTPPAESCLDLGYDRGNTTCSPLCSADTSGCDVLNWRRSPAVQDDNLGAVFGFGANDVNALGWYWVSGTKGGPAWWHYDGTAWTRRAMPLTPPAGQAPGGNFPINDAWGWSSGEVVAVGRYWGSPQIPIAVHYNGTSWTTRELTLTSGEPLAVWGPAPNDVYTATSGGEVLHWNGTNWSTVHTASGQLNDIWGIGGHVYAIGATGIIDHLFNNTWETITPVTGKNLNGIWGSAANSIYVVGGQGTILHYDGQAWTPQVSGTINRLDSVFGTPDGDVFAGGALGTILHYDGVGWRSTLTSSPGSVVDLWGTSSSDMHAVGPGQILHYEGDGWMRPVPPASTIANIGAVWGFAPDQIFLGTNRAGAIASDVVRFDGVSWSSTGLTEPSYEGVNELWGSSPTDLYVASGDVQHYNGAAWSPVTLPGSAGGADGVWGTSSSNVYIVGDSGQIFHNAGAGWVLEPSGTSLYLDCVWGSGPNDVFAVGDLGTILHRGAAGTWAPMATPSDDYLLAVHGSGPNDVFAAGRGGTVLHYNGTSWTKMDTGTAASIWRIWALAPDDVFAVGTFGIVIHYNGTAWSPVRSPTTSDLFGVWANGTTFYATGTVGTLLILERHAGW